MEGPSSRLCAAQDGAPGPAGRRVSGGEAEADPSRETDPSRDMKVHFRVCRFIMEAGECHLFVRINKYKVST